MNILALELSSGQGSVAWMKDEQECFAVEFANDRKHSGLFFENLERALEACGRPERIVVGLGPGSYAGTRIAIATATGLAAATGAELVGLPSFLAMPTNAVDYAVVGDARRQSFYFARVSQRACAQEPTLCTADELADQLARLAIPVFSSEPLAAFSGVAVNYPSARILAQLAPNESSRASSPPLEPIYLREPHITQPRAAMI